MVLKAIVGNSKYKHFLPNILLKDDDLSRNTQRCVAPQPEVGEGGVASLSGRQAQHQDPQLYHQDAPTVSRGDHT